VPDLDTLRQLARDVGEDTALKLLQIFKTDADKRIAAVRTYLQGEFDTTNLRIQAHSLKGLCQTYGASEGGKAAASLEDACQGGDDADIRAKAQIVLDIIPQNVAATMRAAKSLEADNTQG